MPYRRKRRRRRKTTKRRYTVSTSKARILDVFASPVVSATDTAVQVTGVTGVSNTAGETQNRKIVNAIGDLDVSANLAGGVTVELMHLYIVLPGDADFPTVAEFDPFAPDFPGQASYKGGLAAPFGIKRFVFTNPKTASTTLFTKSIRYVSRSQRLLRPGHALHRALYARGSASNINATAAGVIGLTVVN